MGGSDSTESSPWKGQQKYLKDLFSRAQGRSQEELGFYPSNTVAGRSAGAIEGQQAGLGMIRGDDTRGLGAADQYQGDVLGGKYMGLDSNPWLKQMGEAGASDISRHYMRSIAPQTAMGASGRGGSGAETARMRGAQQALGGELGQYFSNLYGGHYESERGRMTAAAGMQPALSAARRSDVQMGSALGQGGEQYQQNLINEMIQRFEFGRDEEDIRLGKYSDIIQGSGAIPGQSSVSRGVGGAEIGGSIIGLLGALAPLMACSRALKDEIDPEVNVDRILEGIEKLPIAIWKYKDEIDDASEHRPHLGPYAEDMQRLFGLGNGREIFLMDAIGITLAGIQALTARVKELETQLLPQELKEAG